MQFTAHTRHTGCTHEFDVTLNLPGRHNVLNALTSIGVALECKAPIEAIQQGLANFAGVGRRFQSYGNIALPSGGEALIIDDYGHHPVEMASTIAATRGAYPDRRLVLAFQPHRYTRTKDLFYQFVDILSTADRVVLTEVYAAGEAPISDANGHSLANAVRARGLVEPIYCADVQALPQTLLSILQDGDVVLTMGAGSINRVAQALSQLGGQPS